MTYNILNDKEIRNIGNDRIDFSPLAKTLEKVILNTETPITIGVYGDWGAGKTSIMWMTKELLSKEAKTIWFNAWKYDKVYDLRVALIKAILKEFESDLTISQKVQEFSKKINWLGITKVITSILISSPPVISKEDILNQDDLISLIGEFDETFNELVKDYAKGKKLIIFIDDIDRCLPEKVIDILEAIKLFLDAENCVFILGVNGRIVENGIKLKYSDIAIDGEDYMEKIIQLQFNLPELREQDAQEFINEIAPDEIKKYKNILAKIGGNPRRIKRIINKFIFQNILADMLAEMNPKFSVDKNILAKLLVIESKWSDLYYEIITSYDRQQRKSTLLLELQPLIEIRDTNEIVKILDQNENLKRYYEDKSIVEFFREDPLLWDIDLEQYIFLRATTKSSQIEDLIVSSSPRDPSEVGEKLFDRYTKHKGEKMVYIKDGKIERIVEHLGLTEK